MVSKTKLPMPMPIRYSTRVNAPRTRPDGSLVEKVVLNSIAGNVGADLPGARNVLRCPRDVDGHFPHIVVVVAVQFQCRHRVDGNDSVVSQTLPERAHVAVGSEVLRE